MHFMKARFEANAFRLWQVATSVEWDCSVAELAAETGLSIRGVQSILKKKGWSDRVRKGWSRLAPDDLLGRSKINPVTGRYYIGRQTSRNANRRVHTRDDGVVPVDKMIT